MKPVHTKRRHPIIVGVAQIIRREKISGDDPSPTKLAARAVAACVQDSGSPDILHQVDSLSVVNMFSETENPTGRLCDLLKIKPHVREYTTIGGNTPQWLVNRAADRIAAGDLRAALLVGAEALYSETRTFDMFGARKALEEMCLRGEIVGEYRRGFSDHEQLHGAYGATRAYPLFENALRARRGLSIEEHRDFLSRHCADFSRIAAENPFAWFREERSVGQIGEVTAQNRMISFPYTKWMNPVMAVNQAAAVLLTSTDAARDLSIPSDRWVYLLAGAEAAEKWLITDRVDYSSSPAIREMTGAALGMAGLRVDQIDFLDLYSCFPSATIIAASEMGLDIHDAAGLTLTGGLACFGGPGNNYTMHAIAQAVERIRENPGETGLVTGVGMYLTKHSVGIYGGREPERPWNRSGGKDIQVRIDAMEGPELCLDPQGRATVETYTVIHDRRGEPEGSVIIARLEDGRRCLARTDRDPDLLRTMETEEFVGRSGLVRPGGEGPNLMKF